MTGDYSMQSGIRRPPADQELELRLVEPSLRDQEAYSEMIREWEAAGEKMEPFVLRMDHSNFAEYLKILHDMKVQPTGAKKTVNSSTYWLVNGSGEVLGAVNIRHRLNEHLLKIGGHIGIGIRPSARRLGYGTRMLEMAMGKAKELGIERLLLTCDEHNDAARKLIEKCGGMLENKTFFSGKMICRYWIDVVR